METIVINMQPKKEDLKFLDNYKASKKTYLMALFINALSNKRDCLGQTEEDFYNFDLLSDTMAEFYEEIETIENEME